MSAKLSYDIDMDSFYEFWNADPDESAPEGTVLAADVDLVVAKLCPPLGKLEECRRSVALAIWKIRQVDPSRTAKPGLIKKQLARIEVAARKLHVEISKLPEDVARKLRPGNFGRLIKRSAELASKITVKASGGAKLARLARVRKMVAARYAFQLTYHFFGQMPTRTKDGRYVEHTAILFRVATGKRGSCVNACIDHFRELMEYGLFDDAMLREWRRDTSLRTAKK